MAKSSVLRESTEKSIPDLTEISDKFRKYFGTSRTFIDVIMSAIIGRYQIDILGFDEWLKTHHGYTEIKHGSIKDFLNTKFGEEAQLFVKRLLQQ